MQEKARVIDSRKRGAVRFRTYVLASGRRVRTVELPRAVVSAFSSRKLKDQIAAWERGEARRERRALLEQRIREGVKPTAIAHELEVTESYVRMVRKHILGSAA